MVTPRIHLKAFSSRLNFANFKLPSTMALPAWSRHGSSCKWPLFRRQTKSHPYSRLATLCLCTALSLQTCGWKPQTCQSNHGRTLEMWLNKKCHKKIGAAYRLALAQSSEYVHRKGFRLMLIRGNAFNAKNAAN
jgi:hypothetical protein